MSETNDVDCLVMLHVFVHSHYDTGEPLAIDVFEISGKVHMQWYAEALDPKTVPEQRELAEMFYEKLGCLDHSAWFLCRMCTESPYDDGTPDHYVEVVHMLEEA